MKYYKRLNREHCIEWPRWPNHQPFSSLQLVLPSYSNEIKSSNRGCPLAIISARFKKLQASPNSQRDSAASLDSALPLRYLFNFARTASSHRVSLPDLFAFPRNERKRYRCREENSRASAFHDSPLVVSSLSLSPLCGRTPPCVSLARHGEMSRNCLCRGLPRYTPGIIEPVKYERNRPAICNAESRNR